MIICYESNSGLVLVSVNTVARKPEPELRAGLLEWLAGQDVCSELEPVDWGEAIKSDGIAACVWVSGMDGFELVPVDEKALMYFIRALVTEPVMFRDAEQ